MTEQTDVTPDSSPAADLLQQPAPESPPQQTETPSTETLNTGAERPHEQAIPYARFKEVNDQLKSLKESQDWRGYQTLKDALDGDPNFAQHFTQAVTNYYTKQKAEPEKDPYADYPPEIAEPLRKTQVLEQTVQQLLQQNQMQQAQTVYTQYLGHFNQKVTEAKVPDHWKDFYRQEVEAQAAKLNPNALYQYDQGLIDRAWEAAQARIEGIRRSERSLYVTDKTKDQVPASSAGSPPLAASRPVTTGEDRAAMVAELLRAGL